MAKKMDRTARSAVSSGMDKRLNPGQKALVLSLLNRYSQDTLLVSWLQRQLSFKWCSNANRPVQFKSSLAQGCEGGPVALSLPHSRQLMSTPFRSAVQSSLLRPRVVKVGQWLRSKAAQAFFDPGL